MKKQFKKYKLGQITIGESSELIWVEFCGNARMWIYKATGLVSAIQSSKAAYFSKDTIKFFLRKSKYIKVTPEQRKK